MATHRGACQAFPVADENDAHYGGLTIRELFAAMVMAGLAVQPDHHAPIAAAEAVEFADALIAELEKD